MARKRGKRRRPRSLLARLFTNRYNPSSRWATLGDVIENVKDTWFAFTHRLPPGSFIARDRHGRIRSASSRWSGPF
jgi:hypothetical protein